MMTHVGERHVFIIEYWNMVEMLSTTEFIFVWHKSTFGDHLAHQRGGVLSNLVNLQAMNALRSKTISNHVDTQVMDRSSDVLEGNSFVFYASIVLCVVGWLTLVALVLCAVIRYDVL